MTSPALVLEARGRPAMHRRELVKPDGRWLWLYARDPIDPRIVAPAPPGEGPPPNPHLRWHPLRAEWIAYAGHRQHRTFLPPPEYDPLAPANDLVSPTEVPVGNWDVAVFENKFPTLYRDAHDPPPLTLVPTKPAKGRCEVIVYTQSAQGSLGELPLWHVEMVLRVWADRTQALAADGDIAYVMPFENRGVEVGVTLPHPHGQLYAYPFVPPIPARELSMQREHWRSTGTGLLETLIAGELSDRSRIVHAEQNAVAFVPAFARYAYEVWVAPTLARPSLVDFDDNDFRHVARALKATLMKLDALFDRPMPLILAVHQAPTDGREHPEAHVHIEIYPALRMKTRLKYLAGSEIGAGAFTADTLPEEKAAELRQIEVRID